MSEEPPSFRLAEGLSENFVQKEGRARWYPPQNNNSNLPNLLVNNSLIPDELTPFRPRKDRSVTWYTCGPTVYDACHMGHARAYLTFDILRRIMEDYFHFDVLYQVNITDVDDKIILRARQNKLVKDYTDQALEEKDFDKVKAYMQSAVTRMRQKLDKKVAELEEPLPDGTPKKQIEKREEALKEAQFKADQFVNVERAVQDVLAKENNETLIEELLVAGHDALAAQLDKDLGSGVTDHEIFEAHARKYEKDFFDDLEALGIRAPDIVTRVTEYVPQIVDFIKGIMNNGYAYESNGSVYFDTNEFKSKGYEYRKLKPGVDTTAEEMAEGEGALASGGSEKKHPNDFALWKTSKSGEPSWESPWGAGRPGWHIECSVMASDTIGDNMDIHAGGIDLMFPHHDNEMAQSEAYHQCGQWVNYFFHAGHLHIKGLKMSKSLKNFVTIRQALKEHSPRQLRLMFLMQPWDKPMNYSDQTVDDAKAKEKYFKNFFGSVKSLLRNKNNESDASKPRHNVFAKNPSDLELSQRLNDVQEKVHASFCDNFKTYEVIQHLMDLVSDCNKYLKSASDVPKNHLLIKKVSNYVTKILRILGVVRGHDDIGFGADDSLAEAAATTKEEDTSPYVDALVNFRQQIRLASKSKMDSKDVLQFCDEVRDSVFANLGIRIDEDNGALSKNNQTTWRFEDPRVIQKDIEEKLLKVALEQMEEQKSEFSN